MFPFISSFLSFAKMIIVGEHDSHSPEHKKLGKRIIYGIFGLSVIVSINSTKNLYYLSKRYKALVEENKGLTIEAGKTKQCTDTLTVREESLKVAISALQDKCPAIVYIDKHCDVSAYGNFLSNQQ